MGSRLMKREKNLHRMIMYFIFSLSHNHGVLNSMVPARLRSQLTVYLSRTYSTSFSIIDKALRVFMIIRV